MASNEPGVAGKNRSREISIILSLHDDYCHRLVVLILGGGAAVAAIYLPGLIAALRGGDGGTTETETEGHKLSSL